MNAAVKFPWRCDAAESVLVVAGGAASPTAWVENLDGADGTLGRAELLALPAVIRCQPVLPPNLGGALPLQQPTGVSLTRSASGALCAQPLGKTRVAFNGGPPTGLAHEFETWVVFRMGQQRYRVVNQACAAAAADESIAAPRSATQRWSDRFRKLTAPACLLLSLASAFFLLALADWLFDPGPGATLAGALLDQVDSAKALMVWCCVWCAASWRLCGASRWFVHLRLAALLLLPYALVSSSAPWLLACLEWTAQKQMLAAGNLLVLAIAALAHLSLLPIGRRRRLQLSALVAVVGLWMAARPVYDLSSSDRTVPQMAASLPMSWGLDEPVPSDSFFQGIERLKPQIDTARAEKTKL